MRTVTGIDIVSVKRMRTMLEEGGDSFLARCFHESETGDKRVEHLSGIFAAKESVMKALSLKPGSWLSIRIIKDDDGRPRVDFIEELPGMVSCDVSISHEDDYAVSVCVSVIT